MRGMCIAIAIFAFAAGDAMAQKNCSQADSAAAEKALDRVVNWDLMYKAWKEYQHCDGGLTEDLFTDAFMRLAVEWKHVDVFAEKYQADAQFKAFVKKQMTSLSAREDVKSLYSRAKQSCPPKLDAFCAEIADAAKAAM
jgi:hypothetical protein